MEQKRRKGPVPATTKQKPSTSKNTNACKKIDVQRHFDPRKTKSKKNNNFPEILLDDPDTNAAKGPRSARIKKRNTSVANLHPNTPTKQQAKQRNRSCSCERKEVYLDSYMSSHTSSNQLQKSRNFESQACINSSRASITKNIPNSVKPKAELVYKSLSHINSSHVSVAKDHQIPLKHSTTRYKPLTPEPSSTRRIYQNEEFFCKFKDPVVQQLKYEIGISKAFCSEEVKNTVVELKAEIAKYRQTLNKNVNLLQGKLDPSMFARNAVSAKEKTIINTETQTDRTDEVAIEPPPCVEEMDNFLSADAGLIQDGGQADLVSPQQPLAARKEAKSENQECISKCDSKPSKDEGTDNPKHSLEDLVDKYDYLKHQKDNIEKVDHLIVQAEKSLNAIRQEFYCNIDGCIAPPTSHHSNTSTTEDEDSTAERNLALRSSQGGHSTIVPSDTMQRNNKDKHTMDWELMASRAEIMRLVELKCKQSSEQELSRISSCTKTSSDQITAASEQVSNSVIGRDSFDRQYDVTLDNVSFACFQPKKHSDYVIPEVQTSKLKDKAVRSSLKSSSCYNVIERLKTSNSPKANIKQGASSASFFCCDSESHKKIKSRSRSSSRDNINLPEEIPSEGKRSLEKMNFSLDKINEARAKNVNIEVCNCSFVDADNSQETDESDCSCPIEEIPLEITEKRIREMQGEISAVLSQNIIKDLTDEAAYLSGSEARLKTISERTEIDESETIKKSNVPKLIVQHMPLISIRPSLQFQKVFQIDIRPSITKPNLSMVTSSNIYYQELKHVESMCFCAVHDETKPVIMHQQSPAVQTQCFCNQPEETQQELLNEHQGNVLQQPQGVETQCLCNQPEKQQEIIKELQQVVLPQPQGADLKDRQANEVPEKVSEICLEDISDGHEPIQKEVTNIPQDALDRPAQEALKEPEGEIPLELHSGSLEDSVCILSEDHLGNVSDEEFSEISQAEVTQNRPDKLSNFASNSQLDIYCMQVEDKESSNSSSILHDNVPGEYLSSSFVNYLNESFSQNSVGDVKSISAIPVKPVDQNPSNSKLEKMCSCTKSSICLMDDFSDSSISAKYDVCQLESVVKSDCSSESVYFVTHDVSTQIPPEDFEKFNSMIQLSNKPFYSQDCDASQQKSKVQIALDPVLLTRLCKSPENQLTIWETQNKDDLVKEVEPRGDNQSGKKTQETQTILNMVGIQYENKEIQKSIEESSYGYAKLHKSKLCADYESTSGSDTVSKEPSRNIPFGDVLPIPDNGMYNTDLFTSISTPEIGASTSIKKLLKKPHSSKQSSSSSVSEDCNLMDDTMSDGEVKCKCSISIGELHLCRYANEIKSRAHYLKKYPEKMLQHELRDPHVEIFKQRAYYDNWIAYTYFTSSSGSPVDSDISRET